MNDADQRLVARVVGAISDRTEAQGDALAATLAARWSPPDRLRRFSPRPAQLRTLGCSCAAGHCRLCN